MPEAPTTPATRSFPVALFAVLSESIQLVLEWVMTGELLGPVFGRLFARLIGLCVMVSDSWSSPDGAEVDRTTRIASRRKSTQVLEQWVPREDRVGTPGATRATKARPGQLRSSMFPCEGSMLGRQRRLSREVCVHVSCLLASNHTANCLGFSSSYRFRRYVQMPARFPMSNDATNNGRLTPIS